MYSIQKPICYSHNICEKRACEVKLSVVTVESGTVSMGASQWAAASSQQGDGEDQPGPAC